MQPFVCAECGGLVSLIKPKDDFRLIRKDGLTVFAFIPEHILIPKCGYCGETYFGQSDADRVSVAMGGELDLR
jgi:hypothetical protein